MCVCACVGHASCQLTTANREGAVVMCLGGSAARLPRYAEGALKYDILQLSFH